MPKAANDNYACECEVCEAWETRPLVTTEQEIRRQSPKPPVKNALLSRLGYKILRKFFKKL